MKVADITGQRFGKLVALFRDGTMYTYAAWRVRCDCGIEKTVSGNGLRRGDIVSCGCDFRQRSRASKITHGKSHTPTWESWMAMRHRCSNPNDPSYDRYGGRGIRVCDRWMGDFQSFYDDMGERPSPNHTIDRKDVNGHYEPSNCRWATRTEQCRNKRDRAHRRITFAGKTMLLCEWAEVTGLKRTAITERLRRGWTVHEALTTPAMSRAEGMLRALAKRAAIRAASAA